MKIDDGFLLREVAGSYVVVAVGKKAKEFNAVINLNETGAYLWKLLSVPTTEEQVIENIIKDYEIDRETATEQLKEFIEKLKSNGIMSK